MPFPFSARKLKVIAEEHWTVPKDFAHVRRE
jgi:hypothetical protein